MHLDWELEVGDNFYEEFFVSTQKWSINRNHGPLPHDKKYLSNFEYMRRENQLAFLNGTKIF